MSEHRDPYFVPQPERWCSLCGRTLRDDETGCTVCDGILAEYEPRRLIEAAAEALRTTAEEPVCDRESGVRDALKALVRYVADTGGWPVPSFDTHEDVDGAAECRVEYRDIGLPHLVGYCTACHLPVDCLSGEDVCACESAL